MNNEPKEKTIPEMREEILRDFNVPAVAGNTTALIGRGLLLLGVEIVDCLRGIEVAVVEIAAACKEGTPLNPLNVPLGSDSYPGGGSYPGKKGKRADGGGA